MPDSPVYKEEAESDCGRVCKRTHLRENIVFVIQIIAIFTVILACIYNLSAGNTNTKLWISLLSCCVGYILPNPKTRKTE